MPNLTLKMPFQNKSSTPIELVLEIDPESFTIGAGQEIEIHAICNDQTSSPFFTIHYYDKAVVVFPPGLPRELVDFYVTCDGVRMKPDW